MVQKHLRIPEELQADIKAIANEQNQSETQTIETALKFYRDYFYTQNKACFITAEMLTVIDATLGRTKRDINARTNTVLSELAIQVGIQNFILAESLEITNANLNQYRLRALDHLKTTNRVLRLDEVAGE